MPVGFVPALFHSLEFVEAEYNRLGDLRDVLRVEAIITYIAMRGYPNYLRSLKGGRHRLLDLDLLIARARRAIAILQRDSKRWLLNLDCDRPDRERHNALPTSHPYHVLAPHFTHQWGQAVSDF